VGFNKDSLKQFSRIYILRACTTGETWFASGESKVFQLSRIPSRLGGKNSKDKGKALLPEQLSDEHEKCRPIFFGKMSL
jgi:hypothetical protein